MILINSNCGLGPKRAAVHTETAGRRRPCGIKVLLSVLVLVITSTAKGETASTTSSIRDRLTVGFYFTASSHQAAFPVSAPGGDVDLLVIDFASNGVRKLHSQGARLLSPFLSEDGARLLVVRLRNDAAEYELLSCRTVDFVCRRLIASKDSITSPTEISADKIVYVASPLRTIPGVRSRYIDHDFWLFETDKQPRQLTTFRLYELNSLSITSTDIYFSAMGGQRNEKIIPKFEPLGSTASDIFKLPLDATSGTIEAPQSVLAPLFLSLGRSTWASVAPDGSMAAFLRTQNNLGGYRYDLVAMNLGSQVSQTIESTGLGFSRPIVVGKAVLVKEIFEDRYTIKRLLGFGTALELLLDISDASIEALEPFNLKVDTGSR